jgi:hypothetical protein
MLNHRRGAGGCSEGANDSRFRQRVWAGRSPAELVIKSSSWPMGWRQSSHSSTNAFPDVAGVSNCGGNHAEVLPKVTRQEGAPSATAETLDGLHSGFAQSSVFPKTTRHVQGDAAAAAITTSVARVKRNNPAALSLDRDTARHWPNGEKVENLARNTYKLLREWKMLEERTLPGIGPVMNRVTDRPGWSIRSDRAEHES